MILHILKKLGAYWRRLKNRLQRYPVVLSPYGPCRGTVLFSYMTDCLRWREGDPRLLGHSNRWECRALAELFRRSGYRVIAIEWNDSIFRPKKPVDLIFDIHANNIRLASPTRAYGVSWLYLTGSETGFQNAAEKIRVDNFIARRGMPYQLRRMHSEPEAAREALRLADYVTLIGNEVTRATYPTSDRSRITLIPVSGSELGNSRKNPSEYCPKQREFLWFFGVGLVHKGLDLLLEIFAHRPELTLNIVGNLAEEDFKNAYQRELSLPNIRTHGYLAASSVEFCKILKQCFCFIAPSCSEGTSAAVVTCLQAGLYPIISRDTGMDLPEKCGTILKNCEIDTIRSAIDHAMTLSCECLVEQIGRIQEYALEKYSREQFLTHVKAQWLLVERSISAIKKNV